MDDLRIIYMGTAEFGLPTLEALCDNYNVVGVVCQPDKPSNRGEIKYSKIKEYALNKGIKVFQPEKLKEDYFNILKENPNLIVTCAYGQIVPEDMLKFPMYGCVNIHASLLPKLRGAAPINRAIMQGDKESGITIMRMANKLDAGDIIAQEKIEILDTDTAGDLHDKLSLLGRNLMLKTIPRLIDKTATYTKQNESESTYAHIITREDEKIDYNNSTREIINQIRGLNPHPGAYSILSGRIVKIWNAKPSTNFYTGALNGQIVKLYDNGIGVKTENGEIIITELQLEGKKRMSADAFMNGVVNKELLIGRILE